MKGKKHKKLNLKKILQFCEFIIRIITQFINILKGLLNFFEYKLRLKNTVSNV
jgi:hypothetical protein